ncbi:MAG TPA: hypothetical protein LFV92_07665, partial [Rickettsia endosymbiont of Ceroptres masudai]|nr:hypothetical protein [Rickettsia endosymbiont of Ceroptres masudai]
AMSLNILKKHKKAIENCNLAIKYNPDYIGSYLEKGIALRKLGKYQEEINSCDLAINCQADYAESYLEKAINLVHLNKHTEAKENFDLALKYKPNLIVEYESIINALRKLSNNLMASEFEEKLTILKNYL